MKQFYELVRVDAETLRFYARCPLCGRLQYGARIPLICRSVRALARCAEGRASSPVQSAFNRAKANATQQLAIQFNQCRYCYQWVCDGCFDVADDLGACVKCSKANAEQPSGRTKKSDLR